MHRCHLFERALFVSHERFRERSSCLFPSPGALALEMLVRFPFDGIIASIIEKVGSLANPVMALFHVLFHPVIAFFLCVNFFARKGWVGKSGYRYYQMNPNDQKMSLFHCVEGDCFRIQCSSGLSYFYLKLLSGLEEQVDFGCCSMLHLKPTSVSYLYPCPLHCCSLVSRVSG